MEVFSGRFRMVCKVVLLAYKNLRQVCQPLLMWQLFSPGLFCYTLAILDCVCASIHVVLQNRNYAGQKLPVASVENARTVEKDGVKYYMYETVQSGSPTLYDPSKNTVRLGLSVTAARPGMEEGSNYLYTLSVACPNVLWDDVQDGFRSCIDSFSMLPPTDSYIPPDKDPWKFI